MAVAWIDNLHVNLESGKPEHNAGQCRGFVPLKVPARRQSKALLATGMIDDKRRDAKGFVAVRIVLGNDRDISRQTDAGVDGAAS